MRSYLFVPGDSERKLSKSLNVGADAIIIDLEDSVSCERKEEARTITASFLEKEERAGLTPKIFVRINDMQTDLWKKDLQAIIGKGVEGIILPKANSGADVGQLSATIDGVEKQHACPYGSTKIIVIATETPLSLLSMSSYVNASSRLQGISWGAEDLATALGARAKRDETGAYIPPIELARSLCLMAAAAAKVQAIDTVYPDFKDLEGLKREVTRAARDGFTGKEAVHPGQIEIINAAFTPSPHEVEEARAIVAAFEAGEGAGVISFEGQMVDRPHLSHARAILERAAQGGIGQEGNGAKGETSGESS